MWAPMPSLRLEPGWVGSTTKNHTTHAKGHFYCRRSEVTFLKVSKNLRCWLTFVRGMDRLVQTCHHFECFKVTFTRHREGRHGMLQSNFTKASKKQRCYIDLDSGCSNKMELIGMLRLEHSNKSNILTFTGASKKQRLFWFGPRTLE